jgi:hypothetical protein
VSKAVGERSTAEFDVRATERMPVEGQRAGIYDHGLGIFDGTVHEVQRIPIAETPGSEAWYRCLCLGWEHRLDRHRIPCAAFHGKSAGEIVQEILDTYAPGEVHIGSIQEGASAETLGTVIYRGTSVADAIADLAEKSNYATWIDNNLWLFFAPREYSQASLEITAANKNYRAPKITSTRADYYNAAVIAISHEAFPSRVITIAGDLSYPKFDVWDPDSGTGLPVGIDIINSIKLNGVEQSFGVYAADSAATFQYTQGQSWLMWNSASVAPGPGDRITVDFYPIGSNIVALRDENEIAARAGIEFDSGIYQAYLEDLDCKDATEALARLAGFLDVHAPARGIPGLAAGSMPRSYTWTMFSHELREGDQDDPNPIKHVEDIWPGRIIRFAPSTPTTEDVQVLIQSLEARDIQASAPAGEAIGAAMFEYKIAGINCTKLAGAFQFYQALAELGGGRSTSPSATGGTARIGDEIRITLGLSGDLSVQDGYAQRELWLSPGRVLRLNCAVADVKTAPVGGDITVDAEYSTDGGANWLPIFAAASPSVYPTIPDGSRQMTEPYGQFSGFPDALDLPARCLVRGNIKQVGSTTPGADLGLQIIGDVR